MNAINAIPENFQKNNSQSTFCMGDCVHWVLEVPETPYPKRHTASCKVSWPLECMLQFLFSQMEWQVFLELLVLQPSQKLLPARILYTLKLQN